MRLKSVGIDVSKKKLDLGLLFSEGKTKSLQFSNDQVGIPSLIKKLKSYQEKEDIPVVIEATGGYHYSITFALIEKGFHKVAVINPLIVSKHLAGSIRKVKTDKKDALLLAKIGLLEALNFYHETQPELGLKRKAKLYHFLKKQLQQVSNRLSSVRSLNLDDDFEIKLLTEQQLSLKKNLEKVKQEIVQGVKVTCPKLRGVSDLNLKAILAEMGNLDRFRNHKQVIAFAGLDPTIKESGSSLRGRSRLSKRGSKTLRFFLYQSAWGVMMHNEKYQKYYVDKKAEGKHYYTCLSAIARKLLCEIYFNLKEHPYSIH